MVNHRSSPSSGCELRERDAKAKRKTAGGPTAVARNVMKADSADAEALVFECVELYVPKKLEHLSEIFNFLRNKLSERERGVRQAVPIDGFSIYEVDGAFYGERVYQERTLVIRILFKRAAAEDGKSVREKIRALGAEIAAAVAMSEEEFWICHYPQGVVIFRSESHESRDV
jgi:hypothetical protein